MSSAHSASSAKRARHHDTALRRARVSRPRRAQVVLILGVLAATVGYDLVDGQLQQGLRDHYVLDSPDAGGYAEWTDSDVPGAPLIYTTFVVYSVANPWDVVT